MRKPYWDYFRAIEDDLVLTSRYVEFCPANYGCYSIEFARIIMAACSELDMLFKVACLKIDPKTKVNDIDEFRPVILGKYPHITQAKRFLHGYDIVLQPFQSWTSEVNPSWWSKGYNKIKHQRNASFHQANLENALNAVSGLMVMLFHYYALEYGELGHFSERDFPRLIWPYDEADPFGEGDGFFHSIDFLK